MRLQTLFENQNWPAPGQYILYYDQFVKHDLNDLKVQAELEGNPESSVILLMVTNEAAALENGPEDNLNLIDIVARSQVRPAPTGLHDEDEFSVTDLETIINVSAEFGIKTVTLNAMQGLMNSIGILDDISELTEPRQHNFYQDDVED